MEEILMADDVITFWFETLELSVILPEMSLDDEWWFIHDVERIYVFGRRS
jgi:hypothetical protein